MGVSVAIPLNRFPQIADALHPYIEGTLDHAMVTLQEVADPLTPIDTGALRANKTFERTSGARTVTWNQHYAVYVHEGTYKMAATPFARIGADAAMEVVTARLSQWGR